MGNNSFNLGMKDPTSQLFYLSIPKNASTMIRNELLALGWDHELLNEHQELINDARSIIVVLRDPVQRWVSGITEYITLYYPEFEKLSEDLLRVLCTQVTFDDHTEQQIYFLSGMPKNKCVFFKFTPNLANDLAHFFETRKIKNNFSNNKIVYATDDNPTHVNIRSQILAYLQRNPKYLQTIKQHFDEDYRFINRVPYYGDNR